MVSFFSPSTVHISLHMCVYLFVHWFHPALTEVFASLVAQWKNTPGRICRYNTLQLIYEGKLQQMQVIALF